MSSGEAGEREASQEAQRASEAREVRLGDQECPRCHKRFTASYWSGGIMVQARCLSCDLKWPRPDMV
jgi:NMD protein affecting ribosome stability and mRNA decay